MANKFVVRVTMESFQPEYLADEGGGQFRINKDRALRFDSKEFAENHMKQLLGDDWRTVSFGGRKTKIEAVEDVAQ